MTPARERGLAVALCVVGSAVVLLAATQRWAHALVVEAGFPRVTVDASGRSIASAAAGLGVVGLAGAVALLATRRVGRVVTGVLLVLIGAVVVVQSLAVAHDLARAVAPAVSDAVGRTGARPTSVTGSVWPWVAAGGGLLVALGGLLTVVRGSRWPGLSRRYDAPETGEPAAVRARPDPEADADAASDAMWKALDRGEDPTDAPEPPARP